MKCNSRASSAADRYAFGSDGISVARCCAEAFVGILSRIGLAVLIPTVLVCALFTPQLARGSRIEALKSIGTQPAATPPNEDGFPNDIRDQDTPESHEMN